MSDFTPAQGHCAQPMVAPVFLLPILSEAMRHQVDLRALLRGLELDAGDFEIPGIFVSHREAMIVVRRALRLLPAAALGLKLGQGATITERGALALGLLAASTLGDAISMSVRFPRSAGYLLHVSEETCEAGSQLVAEPFSGDHDVQGFLVDLTFSALVQIRRQATAERYSPAEVEFVHDAPRHPEEYVAFFGCPVRFGRLRNVLVTHADWLAFRLPWANSMSCQLSSQLLQLESERMNSMATIGFTVERAIRRRLLDVADLMHVAASLNLSERTLRRQLAKEGLSYRELLDGSRKSRAFALMAQGSRSIADIAAATGFSDTRAFTRAFKRWTGHPPSSITKFGDAVAGHIV